MMAVCNQQLRLTEAEALRLLAPEANQKLDAFSMVLAQLRDATGDWEIATEAMGDELKCLLRKCDFYVGALKRFADSQLPSNPRKNTSRPENE